MKQLGGLGLPIAATACIGLALAACASVTQTRHAGRWQQARQMVVVTTDDWDADHGRMRRYARSGGAWQQVGTAQSVVVGRSGSAWGLGLNPIPHGGPRKHEGDGRSPAGIFAITEAFGYAAAADTGLSYHPMRDSDYCVDVVDSPLYNRIVDARIVGVEAVAHATEPMRRDLHVDGDQRYRLGFVIAHNTQATPGAGSCIFAHVWKSPTTTTSGCTAMAASTMNTLAAWLRADEKPVFVLLPTREYQRLWSAWQLPPIAEP